MKLDFRGTIKSNYRYDSKRREIIIEIYDTDITDILDENAVCVAEWPLVR